MADNNQDKRSDVVSSDDQSSKQTVFNYDNRRELLYLMSIDENVKRLVRNGQVVSQSNARAAGNPYEDSQFSFRRMQGLRTERRQVGGFTDEFEKALWESVLGSDFKDKIGKAVSTFADSLGVEVRDIPGTIGKHLGNAAVSLFKSTDLGKSFYSRVDQFKKSTVSNLRDTFEEGYKSVTGKESPWAAAAREANKSGAQRAAEKASTTESKTSQLAKEDAFDISSIATSYSRDSDRIIEAIYAATNPLLASVNAVLDALDVPIPEESGKTAALSQSEAEKSNRELQDNIEKVVDNSERDRILKKQPETPKEPEETEDLSQLLPNLANIFRDSFNTGISPLRDRINEVVTNTRNSAADLLDPLRDRIHEAAESRGEGTIQNILSRFEESLSHLQDTIRSTQERSEEAAREYTTRSESSASGSYDSGYQDDLDDFFEGGNPFDAQPSDFDFFSNETTQSVVGDEAASVAQDAMLDEALAGTAEAAEGVAAAGEGLSTVGAAAGETGSILSGVLGGAASSAGSAVAALGPYALIAVAALIALEAAAELVKKALKYALGPAIEEAKEGLKEIKKVANRRELTRKEYRELANDRYKADIRSIVEEPFNILKDAAEKVEQAWDENLRKINATQGYSKADLQALMATYADRLREDNLSAVVSGSDIINNLSSVLDQGLSGEVANEFAYLATILNAAIPTQDFFGYAGTYSAIAANAIKDGKSQSEAIKYANSQLESFASSVLYASRELSGGFSTGLKNAQSLFEDSFKIAQASRTGVPSEIAGVLTSVAAIVGSIAPDLSTSITDAVTKAATGGNSPDVVALRSLAGINASNTEFLKALANNPQQVFSDLFTNLANMFNDTDDAWMEKAEAYSQVFGLSMDAFARVDFSYLADAISKMKVDNSALIQNFDQLISGETTTNKELLRMQQANKYMIEEGLAYVLDNEAARAIQQHMWDEQIARNIMDNEYAVNLKGKALDFLDALRTTVERIMNILNPIKWLAKSVTNIAGTIAENYGQEEDIRRILEAGKVGTGNPRDLYNLTHRNQDLQLTPNYAELLTGRSAFKTMSGIRSTVDNILHVTDSISNPLGVLNTIATASDMAKWTARETSQISSAVLNASKSVVRSIQSATSTFNSSRSVYDWEVVSKSAAKDLSKTANYLAKSDYTSYTSSTVSSQEKEKQDPYASRYQNLIAAAEKSLATMYDDQGHYVLDNDMTKYRTYDEWEKYILKQVSIRNMKDFLDYGMDESTVKQVQKELKEAYENAQTSAGGQEEEAEREDQRLLRKEQRQFWEDHRAFWDETRIFRDETRDFWQETRDEWARVEEYRVYEKEFRVRQEQFWEDAKIAWKADYDQDTLYFDLLVESLSEEGPIYLKLADFMNEWVKYFVLHEAYKNAYNSSDVEKIQREEKGEASTAVYRLAEALTNNDTELLDPVMQTNALLSQILLVAQAIMQQNNSTTGGNTSLFSSLQATALGLVNTE